MRILIADDHPIFRGGLRRVLEDYGHEVIAECDDGEAVMARIGVMRPDLILMDLQMPVQDGVATLRRLGGTPPAVVLTVSEDEDDLRRAIDAGAWGYLLKSTEPAELVRTLESVASGYRVYPSRLALKTEASGKAGNTPKLSDRQRQVLDQLIQGRTLRQVADALQISEHTVRTYQERLLEKFGVGSRAELIFRAGGHPLHSMHEKYEHGSTLAAVPENPRK